MIIAIDYDNTYTLAPKMWLQIIEIMQAQGFYVMCVTFRHEYECGDIDPRLRSKVNEFIATGRKAKFQFLNDKDIDIDIWIDDDPLTITGAHPATIKRSYKSEGEEMKIQENRLQNGSKIVYFTEEKFGITGSIEENNLNEYPSIFFGVHDSITGIRKMILNQEEVKKIIPFLQKFVEKGIL